MNELKMNKLWNAMIMMNVSLMITRAMATRLNLPAMRVAMNVLRVRDHDQTDDEYVNDEHAAVYLRSFHKLALTDV